MPASFDTVPVPQSRPLLVSDAPPDIPGNEISTTRRCQSAHGEELWDVPRCSLLPPKDAVIGAPRTAPFFVEGAVAPLRPWAPASLRTACVVVMLRRACGSQNPKLPSGGSARSASECRPSSLSACPGEAAYRPTTGCARAPGGTASPVRGHLQLMRPPEARRDRRDATANRCRCARPPSLAVCLAKSSSRGHREA